MWLGGRHLRSDFNRRAIVPDDDVTYYRRRAETELEKAQQATSPEIVRAHFELANAYLERIAAAESAKQTEDA